MSFTGSVLITRKTSDTLEGLVVVNLGDTIVTEEELLSWYCEKYDIEPTGLSVSRLPKEVPFVRTRPPN